MTQTLTVVTPFWGSGKDKWEALENLADQINGKIGHPINKSNLNLIVTDVVQVNYHVEDERPAEAHAMAVLRVKSPT